MISFHRVRAMAVVLVCLALIGAGAALPSPEAAAATIPGSLLAYHGWPSRVNGATTAAEAAAEFGRYDFVVFGGGLESPSHPDHARTQAVIADPLMDGTLVFGYVNLGVSNLGGNLTMAELKARIDQWKTLGADGIQLDAFGYDWEVTRERQNAAVDYVHSLGMPVIANAWFPAHVFSSVVDPDYPDFDPAGVATHLGAGDYYMYESYWVRQGQEPSATDPDGWTHEYWQAKADLLATYQAALGFSILSVTTNGPADVYSQQLFDAAWDKAAQYGHLAIGWGQYRFSADDNLAPYRPRPAASGEIQATCGGLPATVVGTPGADRISGTEHPDVIAALGGPDIIGGLDGPDVICGNAGRDTIRGGDGKDRLLGGAGADSLFGDVGNDRLIGQGGDDFLLGGPGDNDLARGGPLTDTCDAEREFTCEG